MQAVTARELPLRLVFFRVHDAELAVAATDVEEIVGLGALTPLPGVPAHVAGVQALRGQALPVLDLAAYLSLTGAVPESPPRLLVANVPPYRVGLIAHRVLGIGGIDETLLAELELLRPERLRAAARAALDRGDRVAALLELHRLLEAARA
jgi:purine-binding chemotaxis protein CheW